MRYRIATLTTLLLTFFLFSCGGGNGEGKTTTGAPSPPTPSLTGEQNDAKVSLSWKGVAGADYYELYKNITEEPYAAKKLAILGSSADAGHSDGAVTAGSTYHYWLKACNAAGCSDFSQIFRWSVKPLPPQLTVELSEDKADVSWPRVAGADFYVVYRGDVKKPLQAKQRAKVGSYLKTVHYKDKEIKPGSTYYYWAKACKGGVCSELSQETKFSYLAVPKLKAHQNDGNTLLFWPSVVGADHYQLYKSRANQRSEAERMPDHLGNDTDPKHQVFQRIKPGDPTYYYWIRACKGDACSEFSQALEFTYIPLPPDFSVKQEGQKVVLSWREVLGASHYEIYKSNRHNPFYEARLGITKSSSSSAHASYVDTEVSMDIDYDYRLKSCSLGGCSDYSDGINVKVVPASPKLPIEQEDETAGYEIDKIKAGERNYVVADCLNEPCSEPSRAEVIRKALLDESFSVHMNNQRMR